MKTLLSTLSALVAGAFLSIGLQRIAERFDPLSIDSAKDNQGFRAAAMPCAIACDVPVELNATEVAAMPCAIACDVPPERMA